MHTNQSSSGSSGVSSEVSGCVERMWFSMKGIVFFRWFKYIIAYVYAYAVCHFLVVPSKSGSAPNPKYL